MFLRYRWLAVLWLWALVASTALRSQTPGAPAGEPQASDAVLAILDAQDVRMSVLKAASAADCQPTDDDRLVADVALWAMSQRAELALDARAARAAAAVCQLEPLTSVIQDLTESREQLTQMALAFGALATATNNDRSTSLEPLLAAAEWVATLEAHQTPMDPHSSVRARIDAVVKAARPLAERALACELKRDNSAIAPRIADAALMAGREAATLEQLAIDASVSCTSPPVAAPAPVAPVAFEPSAPVAPRQESGPAWLPAPASPSNTSVTAPVAMMPSWLPATNGSAPQPTVRAAELIDRARETLFQEEEQRITDVRQAEAAARTRDAEAKAKQAELQAQQALERERFERERELQMAQVAVQNQALAQRQAAQQAAIDAQRRTQRRSAFSGLLGRVTSAVAGRVDLPPVAKALVPTVTSLVSGDTANLTLPQIPGVSPTAQGIAQDVLGALKPPANAAANAAANTNSPPSMLGPPGATNPAGAADPFAGAWTCTSTATNMPAGMRNPPVTEVKFQIVPGADGYVLKTAVGDANARVDNGTLVVQRAMPNNGTSCQLEVRLQPSATGMLTGTERVSCSNAIQMQTTLQCRR